ncbi:MAG: class II fructose-1,6-bisphosphate aldolase [Malacoplasma sp.]|nr:class II fructose-1,6-bisphosphate aldolase [Malacoplasma sp.]
MFKKSKLVNMSEMLKKAEAGHYAVAHININNLEWIKAALDAAQSTNSPIILGVSAGAAKYMCGFKNIVDMVNNCMEFMKITVPVALHLDHGSFEDALACIKAGFSSVMYDGSKLPFNENIANLKTVIKKAKHKHVTVEAEVGGIGGSEDGHTSNGELADVKECENMASFDIACLAAGIGNIHGLYPADWKGLNFQRLSEIKNVVKGMPLVLHGGTGIPADQIKKAIELGVCKINVNTECQVAFRDATRKYIEEKKDLDDKNKGFDPRKLLKPGTEGIKAKVIEKMQLFGSCGKA